MGYLGDGVVFLDQGQETFLRCWAGKEEGRQWAVAEVQGRGGGSRGGQKLCFGHGATRAYCEGSGMGVRT